MWLDSFADSRACPNVAWGVCIRGAFSVYRSPTPTEIVGCLSSARSPFTSCLVKFRRTHSMKARASPTGDQNKIMQKGEMLHVGFNRLCKQGTP